MSESPTYEETVKKQASLAKEIAEVRKEFTASKKQGTDEDKEMEAAFKKAEDEINRKDKEHMAEKDNMEKVKEAFKKAEDEKDPEKKKEAMKKAIEENEDFERSKKGKRAEDKPKDNDKMEARIANNIMNKIPLIEKILTATKIIDPSNYNKIEKELTAATLKECKARYASITPYITALGIGKNNLFVSPPTSPFVPFQAGIAIDNNLDENSVFEGNVDAIDFSKVKTKDIERMYQ